MVHARLHIICGNCGCRDMFKYRIDPKGHCNYEGEEYPSVTLACGNCATLHDLMDYMPEEGREADFG